MQPKVRTNIKPMSPDTPEWKVKDQNEKWMIFIRALRDKALEIEKEKAAQEA